MQVYLLRHGESTDDIEDSYGGIADFPLTDSGRETAGALAAKLSDSGIKLLYSSPYRRAHETAAIIQTTLGCDLRVVDGLRERNSYGVLSGVKKDKAKEIFAHALKDIQGSPGDYYSSELVAGAEALPDFVTRVKEAFFSVLSDANGHDTVGIVTHGNVTRAIYQHILNVQGKVGLDLLAISLLSYEGPDRIRIEKTEGVKIA